MNKQINNDILSFYNDLKNNIFLFFEEKWLFYPELKNRTKWYISGVTEPLQNNKLKYKNDYLTS